MLTRPEINKVYTDNANKVFKYFYCRLENRALAEDLTSQAFLKFVDRIDQFDSKKASAVTWLFTIARNLLIDYFRSSKAKMAKMKTDLDDAEEIIDPSNEGNNELENFVQSKRNKEILDTQLEILSEEDRYLIYLKYNEDMSYEEIATEIGSNINTVGVRLHRILIKLRDHMEKNGVVEKLDR